MFAGHGCPTCGFAPEAEMPDLIELFVCDVCGKAIYAKPEEFRYRGEEIIFEPDESQADHCDSDTDYEHICHECFERREKCDLCFLYFYRENETHYIQHSHTVVCHECLEDGKITSCYDCGLEYPSDDLEKAPDDTYLCESCYSNNVVKCTKCEKEIMGELAERDFNSDPYCENCEMPEEEDD